MIEPVTYLFSSSTVDCFFGASFSDIEELVTKENAVIITDANLIELHFSKFESWKQIVINPGEEYKQQATADYVINELIRLEADRNTILIGVGGGVITDLTGYIASVYMRGIKCCFIPTTILCMVDAAIGGKNGVDVGIYKNLVGSFKHPEFLLYDYAFLETLPANEWINGFAEIIKHAIIKDPKLFEQLENTTIESFKSFPGKLNALVQANVKIKCSIVSRDEFEQGERRLLNFGHTIGHAIENICKVPHGYAVSVGMIAACAISEQMLNFDHLEYARITSLLSKYQLPLLLKFDKAKAWNILVHDKKRTGDGINVILLMAIGDPVIVTVPLRQLENIFNQLF